MLLKTVAAVAVIGSASLAATQRAAPPCPMAPPPVSIRMPEKGLTWIEGEAFKGPCDDVPDKQWIRRSSAGFDLLVATEGPEGSGRYWTITIGIAEPKAAGPHRGICLMTSTAGWPILAASRKAPLTWLEDLDRDGNAEAIVWALFFLTDREVQYETGLTGWVYRVDRNGALTLDWTQSRRMAAQLAAEYRKDPDQIPSPARPGLETDRRRAAQALEAFANRQCTIAAERAAKQP
jgi:hypothetical protein